MKESVLNDKRILAVDDEPDVLETLAEQLEEFPGLVLDKATDYETGYHLLRSWTYDLVILDIMGVRGFDLLNASVSLGFPTVMLTAHALSVEALKQSIQMGARAYLPKEKSRGRRRNCLGWRRLYSWDIPSRLWRIRLHSGRRSSGLSDDIAQKSL